MLGYIRKPSKRIRDSEYEIQNSRFNINLNQSNRESENLYPSDIKLFCKKIICTFSVIYYFKQKEYL